MVFSGFWIAMAYTAVMKLTGLWQETKRVVASAASMKNASVASDFTTEYLGVGYIIGPRIGGIMVSGSVLSWVALIPLLSMLVPDAAVREQLVRLGKDPVMLTENAPKAFYEAYIRYIGAGAVAMAGIMTLLRTLPTIFASVRDSLRTLREGAGSGASIRTERDIPIVWAFAGSLVLALILAVLPNVPTGGFPRSLLTAGLILVFGFIFVAVSSRIVGIIGSSSNPISGMTIATLLGTCLVFLAVGMGGDAYQGAALCVGSIVCIAAANAGATSQDLKTGYLVGGTPIRQQIGLLIGVFASVFAIGGTLIFMHNSDMGPIGSASLPAPQGTLMATIIKGVLAQDLPWGFIFVGAALAVVVQLCGVSGLAWAVGAYLPISTTLPIFIGGCMRWLSDRIRGQKEESEISSGMLFATGLVAGGAIAGLLLAILTTQAPGFAASLGFAREWNIAGLIGEHAPLSGVLAFALLCALLVRKSLKKLEG
jgi:putative OPT family oligopeptide transporter